MSEQQASYSLSVIDGVDIQEVTGTMAKIGQFQSLVQKHLKQGMDYGLIPGTQKPTLLKPGAEKILMLLGLRSEFEIIDSTRDWEKGFFQYQVRCSLYKGDRLITQGLGAANNREKKWAKQDPFSIDNTVLKISKKRSLVDSALLVGSLSDIFHQDLDDLDLSGQKASAQKRTVTDQDGNISKAQAKRMFAISGGNADLVRVILDAYGYQSSSDIPKTKYDEICSEIQKELAAANATEDAPVSDEDVPFGQE